VGMKGGKFGEKGTLHQGEKVRVLKGLTKGGGNHI